MKTVIDLIRDFDQILEESIGLYLDAEAEMIAYAEKFRNIQEGSSKLTGIPVSELDQLLCSYGGGDPDDSASLNLPRAPTSKTRPQRWRDQPGLHGGMIVE